MLSFAAPAVDSMKSCSSSRKNVDMNFLLFDDKHKDSLEWKSMIFILKFSCCFVKKKRENLFPVHYWSVNNYIEKSKFTHWLWQREWENGENVNNFWSNKKEIFQLLFVSNSPLEMKFFPSQSDNNRVLYIKMKARRAVRNYWERGNRVSKKLLNMTKTKRNWI